MSGDKEKMKLAHYTTEAGAKAIKESGVIKSSTDTGVHRDAVFGRGVYLTTLSPDTPRCQIVENNWDNDTKSNNAWVESQKGCNWSFLHFVFTTLVM